LTRRLRAGYCCAEEDGSRHDRAHASEFFADWFPPVGSQFPGLAPGQDQAMTEAELDAALSCFGPARIGLVPAARPADVLALVGFNGTGNGYGTPELLSAVLRSWEDRFGAALIEVGFDHIRMLVQRPRGPFPMPKPWPPSCTSCAMSSGPPESLP
jgi:hypothetical protein